ncbi:MAG: hypothetical protein EP321_04245 [Sphingomonadales bacterium]|nr:MAG: hypothetical protein EP350_08975 [Alphaproteobacteria bacterium]TNF05257.1 MAG: hypothetical protein EP321_04245 [Sphingomonadales bacterium]
MSQRIFPSNGRFAPSARRPGETLHDYLVRTQWEMRDRIHLLETVRDGQEMIFFDERARWRRRMILIVSAEAGFVVVGYLLLAWSGLSPAAAALLLGLCALLGAIASIGLLAVRESPRSALQAAQRQAWRAAEWLWPVEDKPTHLRLPAWVDASRPETIDAAVEEIIAHHRELEAFFWRARWLAVQSAIIVIAFVCVQIARGTPWLTLIEDSVAVAMLCLVGGGLFVLAADLISTNLGRLGRWWRRR